VLTHLSGPHAIGIDAGGTSTRCAVVTPGGAVVGYGTGPGANRNSGGDPVKSLTTALEAALVDVDRSLVAGGVFGMAGAGAAGRPACCQAAIAAWRGVGLAGVPEVVTDIAVAFAAGTSEPAGIVVFAGTGAGAAVINDGALVRRADGYGWLVGDEGSGVWLGREAVRAALAAYDGRGPRTVLAETVPRAMLGEADPSVLSDLESGKLQLGPGRGPSAFSGVGRMSSRSPLPQAIIKEVYAARPATLGRLAPLVSEAAEAGDPVAVAITEEAAHWLLSDVDAVRPALADIDAQASDTTGKRVRRSVQQAFLYGDEPEETSPYPVVTAGSVLGTGPVAEAVRDGLRKRFGTEPKPAGNGAVGAAGLALRHLGLAP
jgi:glucosamine kinase